MIVIDTQEQAHDFVDRVQVCAQRARSIITELAGDDSIMLDIVGDLNPGLFAREGRLDIMEMCAAYQAKKELNRTDIMNLMAFAQHIGPAFLIETAFYKLDWPDSPMGWFVTSQLPVI